MKILVSFLFLLLAACVSLPRSFHAMNYRNQTVYLDRNHFYKVGPLPQGWRLTPSKQPGIIFKNSAMEATIATEAICGAAFQDVPLEMATNNLFIGMENVKKLKTERWTLSSRDAFYTKASASLDGVLVMLDIVVTKKDKCEFDFYGIAPPASQDAVSADFIGFVKGFDY